VSRLRSPAITWPSRVSVVSPSDGCGDQLGPGRQVELGVHPTEMGLDGAAGDVEPFGDLGVGQAFACEVDDRPRGRRRSCR